MGTVEEIKTAIKQLPAGDAWQIEHWLKNHLNAEWDQEMKKVAKIKDIEGDYTEERRKLFKHFKFENLRKTKPASKGKLSPRR